MFQILFVCFICTGLLLVTSVPVFADPSDSGSDGNDERDDDEGDDDERDDDERDDDERDDDERDDDERDDDERDDDERDDDERDDDERDDDERDDDERDDDERDNDEKDDDKKDDDKKDDDKKDDGKRDDDKKDDGKRDDDERDDDEGDNDERDDEEGDNDERDDEEGDNDERDDEEGDNDERDDNSSGNAGYEGREDDPSEDNDSSGDDSEHTSDDSGTTEESSSNTVNTTDPGSNDGSDTTDTAGSEDTTGNSSFSSEDSESTRLDPYIGTQENYENIEVTDFAFLSVVNGVEAIFEFDRDHAITSVSFVPQVSGGQVKTIVESLKGTSVFANEAPPGLVYRNLNVWVGNGQYSSYKFTEAKVNFKVEKQWLESNNVGYDSILLYNYHNEWGALATERTGEDDAYVYYTAQTPGFSPFAIVSADENTVLNSLAEGEDDRSEDNGSLFHGGSSGADNVADTSNSSMLSYGLLILGIGLFVLWTIGFVAIKHRINFDEIGPQLRNQGEEVFKRLKK
ncbi:hypothetical protein CUN85_08910 [Methanolobus halotolerans]|uniref:PGF-pre-PGF domain-containing protein n=2 Tax=Methanolobus halotolerans TaxID=2052935 RepID=A0A4E0Q3Z2_9EURY|nr:hypothetical protein CUN85_08910 [Methanolobus halotolerans]